MNSDEHNSSSQALNEKQVSTLAHLLYRNLQHAEEKKRYAKAKAVLSLLGMGDGINRCISRAEGCLYAG